MKIGYVLLAAGLLAVSHPSAQTPTATARATPESAGLNSDKLGTATDLLRQFVADEKIAGAVAAVARHGKVVYLETVGVQDLATRTPMRERSLFRIYSMTKAITSVAVLMLNEQGRFKLDEPVSKYLPEFAAVRVLDPSGTTRQPSRPITIEDLLLHTSGLSHRTSREYQTAQVRSRSMTLQQFIANVVRVPLMEDPGTRFRYSESTTVLGRLVEIWSGQPFDRFLDDKVFAPLRMRDTRFWAATPDERARLTTVYTPSESGGLKAIDLESLPFTERPTLLEGAVGLLSTAPDFLRFAQMLLNRGELEGVRLLPAQTVERMTTNGLSDEVLKTRRGGAVGWGLGNVEVVIDSSAVPYPSSRGEYGWDGTGGTIFWVDPASELVTVLMTQSSPADPDRLRRRFKTLVEQAVVH